MVKKMQNVEAKREGRRKMKAKILRNLQLYLRRHQDLRGDEKLLKGVTGDAAGGAAGARQQGR